MPRGSKPGERRGGRQRGTPNSATVAKAAVLASASADPTITHYNFCLGNARSQGFEYRSPGRCIALLTCGKREPNGASQAANGQMYLGAQAAARAASAPAMEAEGIL